MYLRRILFSIFFIGITNSVSAEVPDQMHLLFQDRTITLNFQAQPDLLQKVARHTLHVSNHLQVPIDLGPQLPTDYDLLPLETEFYTEISPEGLHRFFEESGLIKQEEKDVVRITFDAEKKSIHFSSTPHAGFEIDEPLLVRLINRAIVLKKDYIRVPAQQVFSDVEIDPKLKARGIHEIIAVGESGFKDSSPERIQNITTAAKKFNGHILPKGKRFSFNEILEDVDEEDGFVRELVIKGNKTEKELGGGVCQVSTTVFRAAFSGGLPIVQRRNHSYAVPYYKPFGLDAAIYLGAQDFRFTNDTPGDILMQTFMSDDQHLFFVFYGTDDDREVFLEGPFITDYKVAPDPIVYESEDLPRGQMVEVSSAHDGFHTEWVRQVVRGDSKKIDSFNSTYRPWPARVQRGTGRRVNN